MGDVASLSISPEQVCYIIIKAREFDEKVAPVEADPGSNPVDDEAREVLEDFADDPTLIELTSAIESLNIDQQLDLLAMTWLGRDDFDSWSEAREQAEEMRDQHIPSYLTGTPLLGDYLEEALSQLGYSCEDYEIDRL